jgi:hypothetical protein
LPVAGQKRVPILAQVRRLKAGDDRGEGNHLTAPHWIEKRRIKALMRALAWSLVWRVRWVYLAVVRME